MSWPCYMVEKAEKRLMREDPDGSKTYHWFWRTSDGSLVPWDELKPGAMWWEREDGEPDELCVKLPGGSRGTTWNIDQGKRINALPGEKSRCPEWTRTGDVPNVTVTPSINWFGHYHGWLRDGVLTDDCEGRVIPQ